MIEPYYPDILAVDPVDCGCTECLVGEYINEDVWLDHANSTDVYNILTQVVGNNTYQSVFNLVFYSNFSDDSANRYIREIRNNFVELVAGITPDATLEALAEKVSWEV